MNTLALAVIGAALLLGLAAFGVCLAALLLWSDDRRQHRRLLAFLGKTSGPAGLRALDDAWRSIRGDLPALRLRVRDTQVELGSGEHDTTSSSRTSPRRRR